MTKPLMAPLALAVALFTAGCATLVPPTPTAEMGIAERWPLPATTQTPATTDTATAEVPALPVADIGWRDFFADPKLDALVETALANNRDLRVAALNVERARGLYRIQRADRLPSLGASVQMERTGGDIPITELYTAGVGLSAFELDLFGRVRNLSEAALQNFFATEEARIGVQLSLIAEVANAYLTLAADQDLLRVSQAMMTTFEDSHRLAEKRHAIGAASGLELAQAKAELEGARGDVARLEGDVARDTHALQLLAGTTLAPEQLPDGMQDGAIGLLPVPAGMPSEALLRRPDVRAAEHRLLGASANIGAARAAFFPSISLTGSVGSASGELSDLFSSGTSVWSFIPRITLPIFQGGRLRANLAVAKVDRDIALAEYEKAIQAGFRDAADALALSQTLARQREAVKAQVEAAAQADTLAKARYEAGRDSYLTRLVAQRTLYGAQQGLVAIRQAEQANRVALYRALGGGWSESSQ
ncbi:efflux transporter outer membrane subunit [Aerolutibacter ruishenii]|uniref:Multidrug efflux system outer membrane protein n=1 Tax=Aerolutibacter ruishenii TaxID=686800 RepID=A0A562LVT8_9GAMM|nr:efflux transporter outer membrane subunit [Lysobacter ruishenii]TWI11628.1 multidrug efflux system outer membrane protein [Lysobacter ruishenii]